MWNRWDRLGEEAETVQNRAYKADHAYHKVVITTNTYNTNTTTNNNTNDDDKIATQTSDDLSQTQLNWSHKSHDFPRYKLKWFTIRQNVLAD